MVWLSYIEILEFMISINCLNKRLLRASYLLTFLEKRNVTSVPSMPRTCKDHQAKMHEHGYFIVFSINVEVFQNLALELFAWIRASDWNKQPPKLFLPFYIFDLNPPK